MYVYKTTNLITSKIYIGKCVRDISKSNHYYGSGSVLKKSIEIYGKENFKKEIIETCKNRKHLSEREKYWIKFYNSLSPNGYNLTTGGDNRIVFSDVVRNKISKTLKGRKLSEETKLKMSKARKGCKMPDWFGDKISNSKKGKKFSESHKRNLKKSCWNKKRVFMYKEGVIVETFESVVEAGLFFNLSYPQNIRRAIKSGKKYKGYNFTST